MRAPYNWPSRLSSCSFLLYCFPLLPGQIAISLQALCAVCRSPSSFRSCSARFPSSLHSLCAKIEETPSLVHERRESRYDSGVRATDCNGRAAQRLYAERHPVRRTPAHTMFARLHQQLCETGSFQKAARNRDRTARTELNEEIVLDMVETTPSLSTRGIANEIGISYSSVWRILDDSALHPFHYQRPVTKRM
ncbi:DUF4817 domain-containing protein [Trichonephila clavipes]|nr:DUF4817 domain-containing protein [Trichonephila clavipes]